jgi:Glycoside hydrolase 123, N-terminal domain
MRLQKLIVCLAMIGFMASAYAIAKPVDPESRLADDYDLVRNPGFETTNLVKPGMPAHMTIRKVNFKHVKDKARAFAGERYVSVKKPGGTLWFKTKEFKADAVPEEVTCSVRVRGKGDISFIVPFRNGRTLLGHGTSGKLKVDAAQWTQLTFTYAMPDAHLFSKQADAKARAALKRAQKNIIAIGLAIRVAGDIDIDEAHMVDSAAMRKVAAASFVPAKLTPRLTCPKTTRAPVIDGKFGDKEWARATAVTGFSDTNYNLSPVQTVVQMTRDDKNLYISFRSTVERRSRKNPDIAGEKKHDFRFNNKNDYVEIHLTTPRKEYFQILLNPAGGVFDLKNRKRGWQGDIRTASTLEDSGDTVGGVLTFARLIWRCEVAISFASLGGAPKDGDMWKVNFNRDLGVPEGNRRAKEWTTWVKNASFIKADMGELHFIDNAPAVKIDSFGDLGSGQIAAGGSAFSTTAGKLAIEVAAFPAKDTRNALGKTVRDVALTAGGKQAFRIAEKISDVPQMKALYVAAVKDTTTGRLLTLMAVPFEFKSPFEFATHYNGAHGSLLLVTDLHNFSKRKHAVSLVVVVTPEAGGKAALRKEFPLRGRAYMEEKLGVASLPAGKYIARGALIDGAGKEIISGSSIFRTYPKHHWTGGIIPDSEVVPTPFTPIEVRGNSVGVILREYKLGGNGLPATVTALDEGILTAPAALTATVGGRKVAWRFSTLRLVKKSKAAATWAFEGKGADLGVAGTVCVEYDGFARWQAKVTPLKPGARLDGLALEFSLRRQDALYLRAENAISAKRFGVALYKAKTTKPVDIAMFFYNEGQWGFTKEFLHTVWLGGDKRGLTLMTESDEFMRGPKRLEVIKGRNVVTLKYNLVSKPVTLDAPLVYDFAWNATPFKPLPKESRKYTSMMAVGKLYDYPEVANQIGVRMLHNTKPTIYYKITRLTPRDLREGHKRGIKVVPYYSFGVGAEGTPEFDLYAEEIKLKPEHGGTAGKRGAWRCTCPRSKLWRDYTTFKIRQLCGKHKLDGLYLDVSRAAACHNPAHGCGYYDAAKQRRIPTVNVFGARNIFKRAYTFLKTGGRDGVIFNHGADMGSMPFVDIFTQGESWAKTRDKAYDGLTPDFYRTIVARTQYGVPFTFYSFHQYNWRGGKYHEPTPGSEVIMMGMQHFNHFNLADMTGLAPSAKIWRFTYPFWATSEFIPYWDAQTPVSTRSKGLFCATYVQRKEGKATIFVSNWNKKAVTGTVTLDFAKLGFKPTKIVLCDPLGDLAQSVKVSSRISVEMPTRNLRAIVLTK